MLFWFISSIFLHHCNHSDIELLQHCLPVAYWMHRKLKKHEYTKEQRIKNVVVHYLGLVKIYAWKCCILFIMNLIFFSYYWIHLEITSSCANLSFLMTTVTRFIYLTNKAKEKHASCLLQQRSKLWKYVNVVINIKCLHLETLMTTPHGFSNSTVFSKSVL